MRSPDGTYIATVFERNCGATTPFVRVVSLRASTANFDADKTDDWVFTVEHQPAIVLHWDAQLHLSVAYPRGADLGTQRDVWKDVSISYETSSP
jgi:hypothetical protein